MGLTEFALSQSLYMALNHVHKSDLIPKVAAEFDKLTDYRLGEKGSDKLQAQIVEKVLFPLARELYKENPIAYQFALSKEREAISQSLRGERPIKGEPGEVPRQRQNFSKDRG